MHSESIIDRVCFFEVEKHQLVNFEKQNNSSMEKGVSDNHMMCKQDTLQASFRNLGPTLNLLCPRPKRPKIEHNMPHNVPHTVLSPIKNATLNSFKSSQDDMQKLLQRVEEERQLKAQVRKQLSESRELAQIVPVRIQHFLNSLKENAQIPKELSHLCNRSIHEIKNDPIVTALSLFWQWHTQ